MAERDIQYQREKLVAAILYVVQNTSPDRLGAVKLHKVLYYADMLTFLGTGKAITGTTYRKRPFGPASDALLRVLGELTEEGRLQIEHIDYHGFQKKQFTVLTPLDTNVLDQAEKATLDEMIDFVCMQNSAKTISDFSHDFAWQMVEFGEVMSYHNAINLIPSFPAEDEMRWAESEVRRIEAEGAEPSAVEGIDPAVFRKRVAELRRIRQI